MYLSRKSRGGLSPLVNKPETGCSRFHDREDGQSARKELILRFGNRATRQVREIPTHKTLGKIMRLVIEPAPGSEGRTGIKTRFQPEIVTHLSQRNERHRTDKGMTTDTVIVLKRLPMRDRFQITGTSRPNEQLTEQHDWCSNQVGPCRSGSEFSRKGTSPSLEKTDLSGDTVTVIQDTKPDDRHNCHFGTKIPNTVAESVRSSGAYMVLVPVNQMLVHGRVGNDRMNSIPNQNVRKIFTGIKISEIRTYFTQFSRRPSIATVEPGFGRINPGFFHNLRFVSSKRMATRKGKIPFRRLLRPRVARQDHPGIP